MVARCVQHISSAATPTWHVAFLQMLPRIRRVAQHAFRGTRPDLRDELIQGVVAYAVSAYRRLVQLGKEHLGFPSALGRYGVLQTRSARRVGNRRLVRDVMSE